MGGNWWDSAVAYQVYLRSFHDSDGDGLGDLAGLRSRVAYLSELGVDAVWLNPCYVSPQRDHGYDIADYLRIDPSYGTNAEFAAFVRDCHAAGIRVLMDMVANHCSDQHAWFREALASDAGSPARARFLFRDGRGPSGALPPNNWESVFGGSAWTRVADGQWYLHAFDSTQPDLNWRNPEVAEYFAEVLRFWYGLGVDGFRIDVAHGHIKHIDLPDADGGHNHAMWDQPEVHDIYRRWRAIGDEFAEPKYLVGEVWVPSVESLSRYLEPDELHGVFAFDLLVQPWHAQRMRSAIERTVEQAAVTGGAQVWTLANHDVHRTVTRYGQQQELGEADPTDMISTARRLGEVDVELGTRRSRAALLLQLALPGSVFLYQGEELGLPEVFDLPAAVRQDPIWIRSAGAELGRDGCRVPLPWNRDAPAFGFTSGSPWLPQPAMFGELAVDAQDTAPGSTLNLHRTAIAARREHIRAQAPLEWIDLAPDSVTFLRGDLLCVVNLGTADIRVPPALRAALVLASDDRVSATSVPADGAAWYVVDRDAAFTHASRDTTP